VVREHFDVVVAGMGAVGSAALYHLGRRGIRVAGLDPHHPPHPLGSTHGRSRITRRAYFEGRRFIPLIRRSDQLWAELAEGSGRTLRRRTGVLMMGLPDGPLLSGALGSAEAGDVAVQTFTAGELRRAFPRFRPEEGWEGVLEPEAGVLDPEECLTAHLQGAEGAGARLAFGTGLLGWSPGADGGAPIQLRTGAGEWEAGTLVLAMGPWQARHLRLPALPLVVERQVNGWYLPRPGEAPGNSAGRLPAFLAEREGGPLLYGIPEENGEVKAGLHHGGETALDPGGIRRAVDTDDEARLAAALLPLLPELGPRWEKGGVCLYTNTPDGGYRIGRHPEASGVVIACACSGHGFKVSSGVGEAVAALALGEEPRVDLAPFSLDRGMEPGSAA